MVIKLFINLHVYTQLLVFHPILIYLHLLLHLCFLSELECLLCSSLYLCLWLLFLYLPFHPNQSRQMTSLWRSALPMVSSYRGDFPGPVTCLEGSVSFYQIELNALRSLWLWFSALQIKVTWLIELHSTDIKFINIRLKITCTLSDSWMQILVQANFWYNN